ncbi:MAG: hypothetical protein DI591_05340 [Citromicrobium sp.]|nr:MAG: hypothetical protein DI591_05340 [Citromicrobium sp.]
MAKSRRLLRLVHLLAETGEGLTLDEMAAELDVNRRTAERLRDVIRETFDLEDVVDDRRKRFRIPDGLRRIYTRPNAAEIAALQTEVTTLKRKGAAHAPQLESLLGKVKAAFDDREKRRLDPEQVRYTYTRLEISCGRLPEWLGRGREGTVGFQFPNCRKPSFWKRSQLPM